jgi:hypothetical protein
MLLAPDTDDEVFPADAVLLFSASVLVVASVLGGVYCIFEVLAELDERLMTFCRFADHAERLDDACGEEVTLLPPPPSGGECGCHDTGRLLLRKLKHTEGTKFSNMKDVSCREQY